MFKASRENSNSLLNNFKQTTWDYIYDIISLITMQKTHFENSKILKLIHRSSTKKSESNSTRCDKVIFYIQTDGAKVL